jgi:hypothetical protein
MLVGPFSAGAVVGAGTVEECEAGGIVEPSQATASSTIVISSPGIVRSGFSDLIQFCFRESLFIYLIVDYRFQYNR